jgi:predicted DNA-binding transcriptional regulator YafY
MIDATPHREIDPAPLVMIYRNYKGEEAMRRVLPDRIWFGSNDWHQEPQWLMEALDLEKGAARSFALSGIVKFVSEAVIDVSYRQ